MKKLLSILLVLTFVFSLCTVTASADENIKVIIDIKNVKFDVPPTIINGRTLVPLRAIFEALGATVEWDDATQTVTSEKGETKISLTINSNIMTVNGEEKTLDVPATLIDSRTLVPVRAISESFGLAVAWDGDNNIVSILSNTDIFTILYAKNSRSRVFAKSSAATQAKHGWYEYPVTAVYSADGKETCVATDEAQSYLDSGYYAYPVKTVFTKDGNETIIRAEEFDAYIANGYLAERPVIRVEGEAGDAIDYSVYGNTDDEYLAALTASYFVKKLVKNLGTVSLVKIHTVYAGYYEGAFITLVNLTAPHGGKNHTGDIALRLETNNTATPVYGGQSYFSGSAGANGGYEYAWAKELIANKPENFKNFTSNSVKNAIIELASKK